MGWIIGYVVGAVVVLLVVVLLLLMIAGAKKAADQAERIVGALHQARDNSSGLWELEGTTVTASRITASATAAREHLQDRR